MSFRSFFHRLQPHHKGRRVKHEHAGRRPRFETFEDRRMLSFTPVASYETGHFPLAIVTADFNNDLLPDMAIANTFANTYSVRLGDGHGGFGEDLTSDVLESGLWSLAVGDFNNDGYLDLAGGGGGDWAEVAVMLGNGDGRFRPPITVPLQVYGSAQSAHSVAVGDFDADGNLDLAVAAGYDTYDYGYVTVLKSDGNGGFATSNVTWMGGYSNLSLAVGDLNNDGKSDVTATRGNLGAVSVLINNGDGTLKSPRNFATGSSPLAAAVDDLNGDGVADIVTGNGNSDYGVSVLLGDGLGGYGAAQPYAAGAGSEWVVLGDFTGDGNIDIAYNQDNGVSLLHGYGDGTFSDPTKSPVGSYVNDAVAGDFNGDGWLDIVAADINGDTVSVLLNNHSWPVPPPTVSISDATVTEGNAGTKNATFTVTLSKASSADVTVHYDTANGSAVAGSDYTAKAGTVTIAAGQTSGTFTVAVLGDRLIEPTETFAVNLSAPTNANIADGQAIGTILDNEPRISINDVSKNEGNSKTTTFTFTVSLSTAYDQAVTVNYSTANGTATAGNDYQSKTGSITFAPGETTKTITVAVIGDKQKESNETFYVNLSGAIGGGILDGQGLGTIVNDDGGGSKGRVKSSALVVDAAIEDWMLSGWTKRVA